MKKSLKILLCFVIMICICGCEKGKSENWKDIFQVSEVKIDDNYILGKIKNTKDKAYDITIYFELKSGTLIEEEFCFMTIKPNETRNIQTVIYDYDDSYEVKIKKIKYEEIEIPKLDYDNITVEALEYHFEDIYDRHLDLTGFISLYIDDNLDYYPYINSIYYYSSDNIIRILYVDYISEQSISIIYTGEYSIIDGSLQYLELEITGGDKDLEENITTILAHSITDGYYDYNAIYTNLNKEVEDGKCWLIKDWCVSKILKEDEIISIKYVLEKRG